MADDEPTLAKRVQNDELIFPGNWSKVLSPHLRNLITRLLVKDPSMRLNLTDTVEHEWVTEEGSEPIPRFIEPQQQLLRVNSKLFNLVSAEEKSTAISLLEASGGDTPQTPQLRKSPSMPMVGLSTSQARNLRTDSTTSSFVEDDGFDSDAVRAAARCAH
jgi:serine/threonine protein kinase